jgi:hypothetical protein
MWANFWAMFTFSMVLPQKIDFRGCIYLGTGL